MNPDSNNQTLRRSRRVISVVFANNTIVNCLIKPFTAKDNQYSIANLHQNNSNDVFMFSLQSRSQLRRAEQKEAWPDCVQFILLHRGEPLRVCRSKSEKLLANIRHLFCLLFDVYLPRGVCSSRLLLPVPRASQVTNFL